MFGICADRGVFVVVLSLTSAEFLYSAKAFRPMVIVVNVV